MVENKIRIGVEAEDKASDVFKKLDKTLNLLNNTISKFSKSIDRLTTKLKTSNSVVFKSVANMKAMGKALKATKTSAQVTTKSFEDLRKPMSGFDGDALGIMFFGMQLQKWFGGALKSILLYK